MHEFTLQKTNVWTNKIWLLKIEQMKKNRRKREHIPFSRAIE